MRDEEALARLVTVQQDFDVRIARGPRILEQRATDLLDRRVCLLAQPVERVAQRAPPLLVPAGLAAAVAAAVILPARHTVRAAPARILEELALPRRRHLGAELAVVGEPRAVPALLDLRERPRERHVAVAMMMA